MIRIVDWNYRYDRLVKRIENLNTTRRFAYRFWCGNAIVNKWRRDCGKEPIHLFTAEFTDESEKRYEREEIHNQSVASN